MDLVLLSSMLKDLSRVEADVVSHGEAVLNGRLSKSQQRLIQARVMNMEPFTKRQNELWSRFGDCFLRVPLMYQPCCLVPCCQGRLGEIAKLTKSSVHFILSLGIQVTS